MSRSNNDSHNKITDVVNAASGSLVVHACGKKASPVQMIGARAWGNGRRRSFNESATLPGAQYPISIPV